MNIRLAALAAACGLSVVSGASAHAECKLNQIIELPVTMVGTAPTVTVYINGQPAKFMVDSGAFTSSIDTTAAKALGLKVVKIDEGARGVGGNAQFSLTTIDSFALGGQEANLGKTDMLALPGVGGGGVAGLLGENLLGFADIEYDLPHGAIRFFRQSGCRGANLGYWAEGAAAEVDLTHTGKLPVSRNRDPNKYDPGDMDRGVRAAAEVNGQRIIVTFDTGASTSILNTSVAAKAGVTPDTPGAVSVGLFGGIGPKRRVQWIAPFDSFAIGAERINHTRLRFGDLNAVGADMLLGADFFLSHRIFIANSLNKAFISYVGGPVFRFDDVNLAAQQTSAAGGPATQAAAPASTPEALIREATARSGRRDYAGAITALDRAIAADGKLAEAYVLRGRAKLAGGQARAAMADFDEALKLEPENFEALLSRGARLAADGDLAKGRQDLELASKQNTPDGRGRLRVASAYEAAGDRVDAIAQFDAIIAQKATDEMALAGYNGRCWNRAMLKQELDKALADCNQALRISPKDPDVLDSRALVHLRRGELDLALADYDAAVKAQPGTAITLYARGAARLKKGLKAEGQADFAAARKIDPEIGEKARKAGVVEAELDRPAAGPKS